MAALNHSSICSLAWINKNLCYSSSEFAARCRPSLGQPFRSPCSAASLSCTSSSSPGSVAASLAYSSSVRLWTPAAALRAGTQTTESGIGNNDREEGEEKERGEDDEVDHREIVPTSTGFQPLGNKEKKELRAYAHGLGTRLNVQQVGKLGVSQTVVNSISDALEAHEILKVKVLENCSSGMTEIIVQLERGTGGQVVEKIGRTVLLYRASLRKLAAAEKRPERPKRRSRIAMSAGRETKDAQRSRR